MVIAYGRLPLPVAPRMMTTKPPNLCA